MNKPCENEKGKFCYSLPFKTQSLMKSFLRRFCKILLLLPIIGGLTNLADANPSYEWTTDHMQVGVRWQPSASRPLNNAYELTRPILASIAVM